MLSVAAAAIMKVPGRHQQGKRAATVQHERPRCRQALTRCLAPLHPRVLLAAGYQQIIRLLDLAAADLLLLPPALPIGGPLRPGVELADQPIQRRLILGLPTIAAPAGAPAAASPPGPGKSSRSELDYTSISIEADIIERLTADGRVECIAVRPGAVTRWHQSTQRVALRDVRHPPCLPVTAQSVCQLGSAAR
jgi:hypothetical protein